MLRWQDVGPKGEGACGALRAGTHGRRHTRMIQRILGTPSEHCYPGSTDWMRRSNFDFDFDFRSNNNHIAP